MAGRSVTYVVLVAGRYNDRWGKAGDYAEGDPLVTGPSYGALLATDGFVASPSSMEREEAAPPVEVVPLVTEVGGSISPVDGSLVDVLAEVGISSATVLNLKTAGIKTIADVNAATDGELRHIVGIGAATLAKIREYLES